MTKKVEIRALRTGHLEVKKALVRGSDHEFLLNTVWLLHEYVETDEFEFFNILNNLLHRNAGPLLEILSYNPDVDPYWLEYLKNGGN